MQAVIKLGEESWEKLLTGKATPEILDEVREQLAALKEYPQRVYLSAGGLRCPYCGSPEISSHTTDGDFGELWQKVECEKCKREWTDIYLLANMVEV